MGTRALSMEVKRPELKADLPSPTLVKVKKSWMYNLT
jgi:hypothetical protein